MSRFRLLLTLPPLAVAMACGDDPAGASAVTGHYRLETVDGQPLPYVYPVSGGLSRVIPYGDLFLRGDRSFGLGIGWGGMSSGHFRVGGEELRLTFPRLDGQEPALEAIGIVEADSVSVDLGTVEGGTRRHVFRRRARDPVAVQPGVYTLATVNEWEHLILRDETIDGHRHFTRVVFDSLVFLDAVFYRRHRKEETVVERATGEVTVAPTSNETVGGYGGTATALTLRTYHGSQTETLAIDGEALVRTDAMGSGNVERYVRR